MDDKLLEFLLEQNVPTFSMSSGLSLGDFGWGSPTFHKMGREKVRFFLPFVLVAALLHLCEGLDAAAVTARFAVLPGTMCSC